MPLFSDRLGGVERDGGAPGPALDVQAVLAGVLQIMQANNITTDAQWSAFVDSRTSAQLENLTRTFFKRLINIK